MHVSAHARIRMTPIGKLAAVAGLWLSIAANAAFAQTAIAPQPFVATYTVSYRGIEGGTLRTELRRDASSGHYIFETHANPNALARLFISRDAVERTELEVTPEGIRPLVWETDDGKSGNKGDGRLQFDWARQTVTGTYKGKPVNLPLKPGVEDRLSIQVVAMTALLRGKEPGTIEMVNGNSIKEYTYTRGPTQSLDTALGKLDTIIYESTRTGSDRVSRVWHAPSLEYLPVRAEQVRKGKVETVMELTALEPDQGQ